MLGDLVQTIADNCVLAAELTLPIGIDVAAIVSFIIALVGLVWRSSTRFAEVNASIVALQKENGEIKLHHDNEIKNFKDAHLSEIQNLKLVYDKALVDSTRGLQSEKACLVCRSQVDQQLASGSRETALVVQKLESVTISLIEIKNMMLQLQSDVSAIALNQTGRPIPRQSTKT